MFFKKKNILIQGKNNKIALSGDSKIPNGLKIIIKGDNNSILVDSGINFRDSVFKINSSNNTIVVKPTKHLVMLDILINHGDNQSCIIEKNFSSAENTKIWLIEPNCSLEIGEDCMVSTDVHFIASDGHCIFANDLLVNSSKGIKIGKHVWIGAHARILKNAIVPDNSIVGSCSVVTKSSNVSKGGVILAGNPAMVVKKDICWDRKSINSYKKESNEL